MRFRDIYLGIGSLLVVIILLLSDPDNGFIQHLPFGAGTLSILIILVVSILYVGLLHVSRKALLDYIDLAELFKKATQTPEGSGLAIIGIGLIMIAISIVILASTK